MEYTAEAVHNQTMQFEVNAGAHTVTTDYPLQAGDPGAGPRPLELLLMSLASCAGGTMVVLLRRLEQQPTGIRVVVKGQRREEHPTIFTEVSLEFIVSGPVAPAAVEKAVQLAESEICPVWAMLKPGTAITATFRIEG